MPDVYVAVGGNVEPLKYVARALALLEGEFGVLQISPAYRNAAVGFAGDDFVNLVVRFSTPISIAEVRNKLQAIEARCDRPRNAPKWAARTMDLDILLYGDEMGEFDGVVLPRPDLVRRAYMLKPMADLAPDLRHPTLNKTMRELWDEAELEDGMVELQGIMNRG